jgi:hypothetical protein
VRRIVRFDGHRCGPVLDSIPGGLIVSSHSSNPKDPENPRTRCVILVAPGETPPQPLLDLLRDRTPQADSLIRAEHPLLAVARLARLERERRIRSENLDGEWPPPRPEKSILVVVNRDHWRDLSPLFGTIRALLPAVGIWLCTERIAIEVYAGDHDSISATDPSRSTTEDVHAGEGRASDDRPTTDAPLAGDLTQAELQDLLAHFEGIDEFDDLDDEPFSPDSGGPPRS